MAGRRASYVEEASAPRSRHALLPGAVEDPRADVLSPTFGAYRRERRAAECLDGVLAILAIVSSQALFVTGRNPAQTAPAPAVVRAVGVPADRRHRGIGT